MRGFFISAHFFFFLMTSKNYDIILIGATGFTGQRAARYLSQHAPASLNWGIAARNKQKLYKIAETLNISADRCFIVDTTNRKQVDSVVQQTRIIITTAGPFSLYGEQVIAACAESETHYLDITGEVGFIRKMKDKYGKAAQNSGAVLIPFSGFDSVPAEIAVFLLSEEFDQPEKLSITSHYSISGGLNGGTIATMLNKFETGEYRDMNDPRLLMDSDNQKLHPPEKAQFFGYDTTLKRWSVPFIMGTINSKVVYFTASERARSGQGYADSISYSEHLLTGKWYNPIPFIVISFVLICLTTLGPKKWFRNLVKKIMPAPGEGPSEEQIEKGFFKLLAIGKDQDDRSVSLKISYPGDPGNKSTVFFLCESAFCLLESEEIRSKTSGFLTPVSALGKALVKRLSSRGLNVEVLNK